MTKKEEMLQVIQNKYIELFGSELKEKDVHLGDKITSLDNKEYVVYEIETDTVSLVDIYTGEKIKVDSSELLDSMDVDIVLTLTDFLQLMYKLLTTENSLLEFNVDLNPDNIDLLQVTFRFPYLTFHSIWNMKKEILNEQSDNLIRILHMVCDDNINQKI